MFFNGLQIVSSPLVRDVRTIFEVVRWSERPKRRKNWKVQRIEIDRPGCYQIGDVFYMHPDLVAGIQDLQKGGTP